MILSPNRECASVVLNLSANHLSAIKYRLSAIASGFSLRNLKYMRAFAEAWPDEAFVQQVAAQMPWFHNCMLLEKVADVEQRAWYARQAIEHGWSRNVLMHQIESGLMSFDDQNRYCQRWGTPCGCPGQGTHKGCPNDCRSW